MAEEAEFYNLSTLTALIKEKNKLRVSEVSGVIFRGQWGRLIIEISKKIMEKIQQQKFTQNNNFSPFK